MKRLFLIIGAPGSGKTTDAGLIAQKYPDTMIHYSTGDMLRKEVASGSELGRTIDGYISKGALVPLEIVIDTIISAVAQAPVDVVLIDGFPRSIEQMEALDEILATRRDITLDSVIEVAVSEAVARERILGRRSEAAPDEVRSDDNEAVFAERMAIYTQPLEAIETFYRKQGILHTINGERSLEEVVADMERHIVTTLA